MIITPDAGFWFWAVVLPAVAIVALQCVNLWFAYQIWKALN